MSPLPLPSLTAPVSSSAGLICAPLLFLWTLLTGELSAALAFPALHSSGFQVSLPPPRLLPPLLPRSLVLAAPPCPCLCACCSCWSCPLPDVPWAVVAAGDPGVVLAGVPAELHHLPQHGPQLGRHSDHLREPQGPPPPLDSTHVQAGANPARSQVKVKRLSSIYQRTTPLAVVGESSGQLAALVADGHAPCVQDLGTVTLGWLWFNDLPFDLVSAAPAPALTRPLIAVCITFSCRLPVLSCRLS